MDEADSDALLRMAAFEQVRRLTEAHDHLTVSELQPGFFFDGKRIPLICVTSAHMAPPSPVC